MSTTLIIPVSTVLSGHLPRQSESISDSLQFSTALCQIPKSGTDPLSASCRRRKLSQVADGGMIQGYCLQLGRVSLSKSNELGKAGGMSQ